MTLRRPLRLALLVSVAAVLLAACSGGSSAGPSLPPANCQPTGSTQLTIKAGPGAAAAGFDKGCLAVKSGTPFSITFVNADPGVPHNVEIFTNESAKDRLGGASGPSDLIIGKATTTYHVKALPPGKYFFRCDVHPTTMVGTLIVSK